MGAINVSELVPEQIGLNGGEPDTSATAYLVDQWGRCFAVADGMTVGRRPEEDGLRVAFHTVSGVHAGFREPCPGAWTVEDFESTNGTEVNEDTLGREEGRTLAHGDRVAFGGVTFFFVCEQLDRIVDLLSRAQLSPYEKSTNLVKHRPRRARRVELTAYAGSEVGGMIALGNATVELSLLEFAFVDRLIRAALNSESDGFVQVQDFDSLPWMTPKANFNRNMLSQMVFRLRTRLSRAGLSDIVETGKRGQGYRLKPEYAPNLEAITA